MPDGVTRADATIGPEGRLVVYEWTAGRERRRKELESAFGMMVFYDIEATAPKPRFELFVQEEQAVFTTEDPEAFKALLGTIPAGEQLDFYNTCAGGTHHGLDKAVIRDITRFCEKRGIVLKSGIKDVKCICVCL